MDPHHWLRIRTTLMRIPLSYWCGSGCNISLFCGSGSCYSTKWCKSVLNGSILSFKVSIVSIWGPPVLHFEPPHLLKVDFDADPDPKPGFDFVADPDPAFHSDEDPDPVSHNYADPQPQRCLSYSSIKVL
jgi:hypothetical protein